MKFYTDIRDYLGIPAFPPITIIQTVLSDGQFFKFKLALHPPDLLELLNRDILFERFIDNAIIECPESDSLRSFFRSIGYRSQAEIAAEQDPHRTMLHP